MMSPGRQRLLLTPRQVAHSYRLGFLWIGPDRRRCITQPWIVEGPRGPAIGLRADLFARRNPLRALEPDGWSVRGESGAFALEHEGIAIFVCSTGMELAIDERWAGIMACYLVWNAVDSMRPRVVPGRFRLGFRALPERDRESLTVCLSTKLYHLRQALPDPRAKRIR